MKAIIVAATCGLLVVSAASAQVLENFEHGNVGLYTAVGGNPNMFITAAAAHDGALGARFEHIAANAFFYRTDVPTAPGNTSYIFVRSTGATGRFYLGVGASHLEVEVAGHLVRAEARGHIVERDRRVAVVGGGAGLRRCRRQVTAPAR